MEKLINLIQKNEMFQGNNILTLVGKYDEKSKYNIKNMTRELKQTILAVPYNTMYYEATTEGKVADYFLNYRTLSDKNDSNAIFLAQAKEDCEIILEKVREVELKR